MPKRIQRKRTKGWRLPDNARCVTRPGRWGNPWKPGSPEYVRPPRFDQFPHSPWARFHLVAIIERSDWHAQDGTFDAETCVRAFRSYAELRAGVEPDWLEPLRGLDLACYCAPGAPCHADVLLDLANR